MPGKRFITVIIAVFFITSFLFSSFLFLSNNDTTVGAQEDSTEPLPLNIYYLDNKDNKSAWLIPYIPDEEPDKRVIIGSGEYLNVSQGLLDRKYNTDIKPEVELYIDTHNIEDLTIHVRLEFRYFLEEKLPHDPNVISYFDTYETRGYDDEPELVKLTSTYYSEVPVDIEDPEFGGIMRLSVSFEGGDVNDTVDVMCGEDGYHSFITTPYDRSYSSSLLDNNDDGDVEPVNTTLCYTVGILFLVVIVVIIIYMHFREKE